MPKHSLVLVDRKRVHEYGRLEWSSVKAFRQESTGESWRVSLGPRTDFDHFNLRYERDGKCVREWRLDEQKALLGRASKTHAAYRFELISKDFGTALPVKLEVQFQKALPPLPASMDCTLIAVALCPSCSCCGLLLPDSTACIKLGHSNVLCSTCAEQE